VGIELGGVALLGAFHGANPAMGWLFAVALGLQERSRRLLLLALVPIAAGHEVSVALTVLVVQEARLVASDTPLRVGAAALLAGFAVWRLVRARHLRWVGMRVSLPELAWWSFLVTSAHGAGLMLVPVLLNLPGSEAGGALSAGLLPATAAALAHTAAAVLVAAAIALAVYDVVGLRLLRRGWVNVDRVWALSLLAAAAATLVAA
jgi:hypothetical protein